MYFLLLFIWIIFNGQVTLETVLFGVGVSALVYAFICRVFDFSVKKDIALIKVSLLIIEYLFVLFIEMIKANIGVIKLITTAKYDIEPALVTFRTDLSSKISTVVLANSITLTPGTITVNLNDGNFTVHCLDKTLADGIDSSIFVKLLKRMENVYGIRHS